ncbi:hypothetical protein [Pseudomonas phage PCS5]|nr:hypothetical protein [Pseudomonas phage PCS5]
MASVIVAASLKNNGMDYLSNLGLAGRTLKHGHSLSTPTEIAGSTAEFYHKWVKANGLTNNKQVLKEFYTDICKLRLAKDGNAVTGGYMILDGTLQGVFSFTKGMGPWLIRQAIAEGARKLDCFDGFLPEFYKQFGFVEVRREANWTKGGPDVVFMEIPE